MTRQHFARIAKALQAASKDVALTTNMPLTREQYDIIVDQLALACGDFNQKFNYDRFVDACNS
jgi:hypothetical protein